MKKYIKYLIIVLLIIITTGCATNYKRKDIINYVKNRIGLKNFSVSSTYKVFDDADGYSDRYWTVYDKDNDVEFYVIVDYYYSAEMTENRLETDYYAKYYVKYENEINKSSIVTYEKLETYDPELGISLYCTYKNKKELKDCYDAMSNINNVFKGKAFIPVNIKYVDSKNKNRTYVADYTGNLPSVSSDSEELYYKYFFSGYIFNNSSILSEMSTEEYNSLLKNENNTPLVKGYSDTNIISKYNNMFCGSGSVVSYNTLYNILKEEGYNVVGDSHNYKVYYKNDVYEFSDNFEEYSSQYNVYVYYYKKNGIKETATYNHMWERFLSISEANEKFGLQLYCDWKRISEN